MKKTLITKTIYLLTVIILLSTFLPQTFATTDAQPQSNKIGSFLSFLMIQHSLQQKTGMLSIDDEILSSTTKVTICFTEVKSPVEAAIFEEETGAEFYMVDGEILHASTVYPVKVPWDSIEAITGRGDVLRIESAVKVWEPLLDLSIPEIGADQVWNELDPIGRPKMGEGVIIADLDTGVNWEHEQFWYPDGTGKVERILDATGEYVRPNLAGAVDDTNGHGTSVAHVLLGGQIGGPGNVGTYVGVAPSASLFAVKVFAPSAVGDIVGATWAQNRGANVIIYEFGGWSYGRFMDGSSNTEATIDTLTATGTVVVVPSGNLAGNWLGPDGRPNTGDEVAGLPGSERHARTTVPGSGSVNVRFNPSGWVGVEPTFLWITVLWRNPANNLGFTITTPTPAGPYALPPPATPLWGSIVTADGHTVDFQRDNSVRGTAAFNIVIWRADGGSIMGGDWTLNVANPSVTGEDVNLFNNDGFGWQSGTYWVDFRDDSMTITEPSTADTAISVASYATRARITGTVGDFSFFTGMGPRIDGVQKPDIAAPGHYDVWAAQSEDALPVPPGPNTYDWFGGTSAAGPHVAGTAALMLQADPTLSHGEIKTILRETARQDTFTGSTPNSIWGWGKLDAYSAVEEVQGDFTIKVEPSSDSVCLGRMITATVTLTPIKNYYGTVTLSATGQPPGAIVSFDPASGIPPFTSTMTITGASESGTYTIIITGTGQDGTTHTTTYALEVAPCVGGFIQPVNKLSLLITWIGIISLIIMSVAVTSINKRYKT